MRRIQYRIQMVSAPSRCNGGVLEVDFNELTSKDPIQDWPVCPKSQHYQCSEWCPHSPAFFQHEFNTAGLISTTHRPVARVLKSWWHPPNPCSSLVFNCFRVPSGTRAISMQSGPRANACIKYRRDWP